MHESDRRLANIFGALTLAVADDLRDATETATGQAAAWPSALVALHEFLDRPTVDELRRVVGLTHSGAVRLIDLGLAKARLIDSIRLFASALRRRLSGRTCFGN